MASMLSRKWPFFDGSDPIDQLSRIGNMLGSTVIYDLVEKHQFDLTEEAMETLQRCPKEGGWNWSTEEELFQDFELAKHLLDSLLVADLSNRISADVALNHQFFSQLNEM